MPAVDYAILGLTIINMFALLPTVRDAKARIPRMTSGTAAFVSTGFTLTYLYMGLTFSVIAGVINASLWCYVLVFKPTVEDYDIPGPDMGMSDVLANEQEADD